MLLSSVQYRKEIFLSSVVCFLRSCKAALVHAVVDLVRPDVDFIDSFSKGFWVEVQGGVLRPLIEIGIQEAYNLSTLVVHHRPLLLVPQYRHSVLAGGVSCDIIQVTHELAVLNSIWYTIFSRKRATLLCSCNCRDFSRIHKLPSAMDVALHVWTRRGPSRMHNRNSDDILQTLHVNHSQGPVRPRARVCNVEVIAMCSWWKLTILRNRVPERAVRSLELPLRAHLIKRSLPHSFEVVNKLPLWPLDVLL
mmetsp:Transcript_23898/g.40064  ORF Transcript_23898/g.40064 Transcript_23898/m.40064 type:complete len:250 (+) Transcript_23898:576-1325(+)